MDDAPLRLDPTVAGRLRLLIQPHLIVHFAGLLARFRRYPDEDAATAPDQAVGFSVFRRVEWNAPADAGESFP